MVLKASTILVACALLRHDAVAAEAVDSVDVTLTTGQVPLAGVPVTVTVTVAGIAATVCIDVIVVVAGSQSLMVTRAVLVTVSQAAAFDLPRKSTCRAAELLDNASSRTRIGVTERANILNPEW